MMITEKELRKKTTSGLKSSKATTTSTLQDQAIMSEDHLHHTTKSIKSRMTTIQQLKVIILIKISTTIEVNSMKEHFKDEALAQEDAEEEEEEEHLKTERYLLHHSWQRGWTYIQNVS